MSAESPRPAAAPRALAPLWAQAMLALALASLAPPAPPTLRAPALAALITIGLAAVVALGWPDLRRGRVALLALAGLAGLALGLRPGAEPDAYALWPVFFMGGAAAALRRPGDPSALARRRRLALAYGGALVAGIAVESALAARGLPWVSLNLALNAPPYLAALATVAGAWAGQRVARRMGPALVIALLVALYGAVGLERGGFWTRIEQRLDTGDRRTFYVGFPFLPLSTEETPEPERSRLLELARGYSLLAPEWRTRATFYPRPDDPFGVRGEVRLGDMDANVRFWIERDPRIARWIMLDLAEWIEAGYPLSPEPECRPVLEGEPRAPGAWRRDMNVEIYCYERGLDLTGGPIRIAETADGLEEQISNGGRAVEIEAAERLAQRFPERARVVLPGMIRLPDPEVRAAVAGLLADLEATDALPLLRKIREIAARIVQGGRSWREERYLPAFDAAIARLEAKAREAK